MLKLAITKNCVMESNALDIIMKILQLVLVTDKLWNCESNNYINKRIIQNRIFTKVTYISDT